jgi:tetratricopeptide (TPR) repeat protein
MRHPGEEGALLLALAELLDSHGMSVTFNGRSFDLPLLRTRFQQNQRIYGDLRGSGELLRPERPHLDLLHPARRLWRRRLQSCRLVHLEESILAVRRSEEDVPGHLIPQLYADFVQSGNAGAMRRVFYHNLEDILSMVALATQLSCAFGTTDSPPLEREDWLALGQCLEERQQWAEAESAYRRAIDLIRTPQTKGLAFNRLGRLLKRQERWQEAADTWERWLTTVPGVDPTPYVELAKFYEWQQADLDQAIMWTQWALHTLRTAATWQRPPGALPDLERRLARLERKRKT